MAKKTHGETGSGEPITDDLVASLSIRLGRLQRRRNPVIRKALRQCLDVA